MPMHRGRRWAGGPLGPAGVAFAALSALALAGCAGGVGPDLPAGANVPAVDDAVPLGSTAAEARLLADRILQRESDDVLLDGARQRALGHEIGRALALIRERDPAMAAVFARDRHSRELILQLEGALRDRVVGLWRDGEASALPHTGQAAFDALNETLGLRAVMVLARSGSVVLSLGERANMPAALRAYEAMDGVDYAEPNYYVGDDSDIEVTTSGGTWYVVFRRAWGDCPSGCIYRELSFFTVAGGEVERVEPARARGIDAFAALLEMRGWR